MNPWLKEPLLYPSLPSPQVDVAIIGSSLCALYIAQKLGIAGHKVAIFEERKALAFGFSRRSLGRAQLGLGDNPYRLNIAMGAERTAQILRFSAHSLALLSKWAGFQASGGLEIAKDPREEAELDASYQLTSTMALPSTIWCAKTVTKTLQTANLLSARFLPQEGLVDLYALAKHLVGTMKEANVAVHCPIQVHEIQDDHAGQIILHEKGETRAEIVIYVSGLHLPRLLPYLSDKHTTVRSQAIGYPRRTPPHPLGCRTQYGYIYWRDFQNLRLIGGCRWATPHLEQGETDDTITIPKIEQQLQAFAKKTFMEEEVPVYYRWSGIEERSCDGLPIIGPVPGRIDTLLCSALQGRELGLGFAAGEAICELLLKGEARQLPDVFSPRRFL